jgi:hypothetical protein
MSRKYFERLQNIDRLIRIKATGTPKEFAQKLYISESRLYSCLSLMKDLGAPVRYCKQRQSYYYEKEGGFCFQFMGK